LQFLIKLELIFTSIINVSSLKLYYNLSAATERTFMKTVF
jgi:hypothetical protein